MRDALCSVLNTDVKRELDHMATFFHMVVQYKAKIGATYQVHTLPAHNAILQAFSPCWVNPILTQSFVVKKKWFCFEDTMREVMSLHGICSYFSFVGLSSLVLSCGVSCLSNPNRASQRNTNTIMMVR